MRDVGEIIIEYLAQRGYDGLSNNDLDCACAASDLAPCGDICLDCEPGDKIACDCGEHDWHIARRTGGGDA